MDYHVLDGRVLTLVDSYVEAEEILRRGNDFVVQGAKPESVDFLGGTLVALDGQEHLERRRLLTKLVSHEQIEAATLLLEKTFDRVWHHYFGDSASDPRGGFDLVEFGRYLYYPLSARMIGLDGVGDLESVEELDRLAVAVVDGTTVEFADGDHRDIIRRGILAKEEFRQKYVEPSLERRKSEYATGQTRGPGEQDLISLMVDAQWPNIDEESILREAILFLVGSVNNPVAVLAWSLAELEGWASNHPEQLTIVLDENFLRHVVDETLRLHRTGNPILMRRAARDVDLRATGRAFAEGEWIGINLGAASRDPEVFGMDAASFVPDRLDEESPHKPYGLAFGSGPHVCIGRPLITPSGRDYSLVGIQVAALRRLIMAGVRPDPSRPPVPAPHGGDRFASFPVVLAPPLMASGGTVGEADEGPGTGDLPAQGHVALDRSVCEASGFCQAIADTHFGVGEDGLAELLSIEVSPTDRPAVEEAASACPSRAIALDP